MSARAGLTYALISPVRNERDNLPRLAAAVVAQRQRPTAWLIVDNGSDDDTVAVATALARAHDWIRVLTIEPEELARGRPIVRSLHAGFAALDPAPDVVVNVDADVSFGADYFAQLLSRFEGDPRLGIASGSGYELQRGVWTQRHVTGSTVWGATRAYRWQCLQEVLPLEERLGWDGMDEFKANARGWRTKAFTDLPFYHHRPEGVRDGARYRMRLEQGRMAHYAGYRFSYLVLRAVFHAWREPSALALVYGYLAAALRREPRSADVAARAYLRSQQRLTRLPLRLREALGKGG